MLSKALQTQQAKRFLAALIIGLLAFLLALATRAIAPLTSALQSANNLFYDNYYRLRPFEDQTNSDVVIVAADQSSLDAIDKAFKYGWPWPREFWSQIATYAANAGAKAIAFDIVFYETSQYQNQTGDDDNFRDEITALKTPILFGSEVEANGDFHHFAPPIANPHLAATNVGDDKIYRFYQPVVLGHDSLATAAAKASGAPLKLDPTQPFLLHYYGPNVLSDGRTTFRFISAAKVLDVQLHPEDAAKAGITPDLFKNKIVLFGAITAGTYDLKSSPLSPIYPGVEVQATALENLLHGQQVQPLQPSALILTPLLCSLLAAFGVVIPRKASLKLLTPLLTTLALLTLGILLFRAPSIQWLPPAESLLSLLLATPAAFAYTYFAEDRQRRFMLKALSKVVSPAIAEQLAKDPQRLALGTVRTTLTLLFTDLANFTDLSESMDVEQLGKLLNHYLGEMSDQIFLNNGTLDKYIGDAVMCFWNAPLPQPDHARLACRAALAMAETEKKLRATLGDLGQRIFTRIGINTTSAAVGFVGSSHLFNYTALGDGVNLASRLEGANKIYGTRILLSENTAALVRPHFHLRKLDDLRVKGKTQPMPVYELLSETTPTPPPLIHAYESALKLYQSQQWDQAEKLLLELCQTIGEDAPSRTLLKRIVTFRKTPPPADWDGVYEAKEK